MNSLSGRSPHSPTDQPCSVCKAPAVPLALRTAYVLYYRCPDCGEIWTLPTWPQAAVSWAINPEAR